MKKLSIVCISCILFTQVLYSSSLQQQISAVSNANNEYKAAEQKKQEEREKEIQAQAAFEKEQKLKVEQELKKEEIKAKAEIHKKQLEAEKERNKAKATALALEKTKKEEVLRDKERNQGYEDQLRTLELEEKKAELEMKKSMLQAKSKKSDDFIDKELKSVDQDINEKKAQNDLIQSKADATRNYSEGAKEMMKGVGKGAENKSIFDGLK